MHFCGPKNRVVKAVDGVSLYMKEQEIVGLVGESGCGKSATCLAVMRLIPSPPGRLVAGEIKYRGLDLVPLSDRDMMKIRGKEIAMVFQDPMTSLNPSYTVEWQLSEAIAAHEKLSKQDKAARVMELLRAVGIAAPEQRAKEYPHRLSGGMRQRVMLAMALACRPKLLIADEPTTSLDVTVQAQILDLLRSLQQKLQMSVLLVSHDLGVVAETAQRVVVMYAGQVVEEALTGVLFVQPQHPYTEALLASIPSRHEPKDRLRVIPGNVPDLVHLPNGCRFYTRCQYAAMRCERETPLLRRSGEGHRVRCWRASGSLEKGGGQH